jgi:hypothetical protein
MTNMTSGTAIPRRKLRRLRVHIAAMLGAVLMLSVASAIPAAAETEDEATAYPDERVASMSSAIPPNCARS